ncbi:MAG: hypothetical protein K2I42_00405 [Anaeroplasmataceae bacterium]|nr:hypothetical protein [Anaeroplasmataceae bacterium]
MKTRVLISFIVFFLLFFCGFGMIVFSALNKNVVLMYLGIGFLCLGCIGYSCLFIVGLRIYLKKKLG